MTNPDENTSGESQPLLQEDDNHSIESNSTESIWSTLAPCVMLLIGILLISLAAWPLLPHQETIFVQKDIGERRLVSISPYWFSAASVSLVDKHRHDLSVSLFIKQPELTHLTKIYRSYKPDLQEKSWSVQKFVISSVAELDLSWLNFSSRPNLLVLHGSDALNLWYILLLNLG